jgi:hypothetical protein
VSPTVPRAAESLQGPTGRRREPSRAPRSSDDRPLPLPPSRCCGRPLHGRQGPGERPREQPQDPLR